MKADFVAYRKVFCFTQAIFMVNITDRPIDFAHVVLVSFQVVFCSFMLYIVIVGFCRHIQLKMGWIRFFIPVAETSQQILEIQQVDNVFNKVITQVRRWSYRPVPTSGRYPGARCRRTTTNASLTHQHWTLLMASQSLPVRLPLSSQQRKIPLVPQMIAHSTAHDHRHNVRKYADALADTSLRHLISLSLSSRAATLAAMISEVRRHRHNLS